MSAHEMRNGLGQTITLKSAETLLKFRDPAERVGLRNQRCGLHRQLFAPGKIGTRHRRLLPPHDDESAEESFVTHPCDRHQQDESAQAPDQPLGKRTIARVFGAWVAEGYARDLFQRGGVFHTMTASAPGACIGLPRALQWRV